MPDKSISQLTAGVAVSDTDLLPNVQVVGVGPVKTTAAQIKSYVNTNPVVTGVVAAPAGSAAAPSFTFDGDLNTGWFRPAADTIAGATNGTERMRIDSSGNVIVGGTSAILTGAGRGNITINGSTDSILSFGIGGVTKGYLYSFSTGMELMNVAASYLTIGTNNLERIRIDTNGNVGIGNSSPAQKLDVTGSVRIKNGTNGYLIGPTNEMLVGEDNTGVYVGGGLGLNPSIPITYGQVNTTFQRWNTTGGVKMTLDGSGNLGIGTTGPTTRLHVSGGDASVTSGNFVLNTAGGRFSWGVSGVFLNWIECDGVAGNNYMRFATGNAEVMRILSSGLVGIGTTSPGAKLEIQGSANSDFAAAIFRNTNVGSSAATSIRLGNDVTATASYLSVYSNAHSSTPNAIRLANAISGSSSQIIFATNGDTERMRIDASGNVGIGVTPSAWATGQTAIDIKLVGHLRGDSGTVEVGCNAYYSNAASWIYKTTAPATTYYQNAGSHVWLYAASGTAGTAVSFLTGMVLSATGNLGVGAVPSSWLSTIKAVQAGPRASLASAAGTGWMGYNSYYDGAFKYIANDFALEYRQNSSVGSHTWWTAPSGTAGNVITFSQVMTLAATGNLGVGTTNPAGWRILSSQAGDQSLHINNSTGDGTRFYMSDQTWAAEIGQIRGDLFFRTGGTTNRMSIDAAGNVVVNTAAVATTATNGFLYVPGCAGTPTGVPTAYTGRVPIVVDTTNNKLYFYSGGAWRDAGP